MSYVFPDEQPEIATYVGMALDHLNNSDYWKKNILSIKRLRLPIQEFLFTENIASFRSIYKNPETYEIDFGFHGTADSNLESIIHKGFLAPYDSTYNKKNGNVYGKGVYVTKTPSIAAQYARNKGTVIMAAFIYGESEISQNKSYIDQELEFNSLIVNEFAVVLQGSTQVLPLFAIKVGRNPKQQMIETTEIGNRPSRECYELATEMHQTNPGNSLSILIHLITLSAQENKKFDKNICRAKVQYNLDNFTYSNCEQTSSNCEQLSDN